MMEHGLALKVVCETDASAVRAMATRRGVGRVRHLDARLLLLQTVVRREGWWKCEPGLESTMRQTWEHRRLS